MTFSIVIPAYNVSQYLPGCLDSVLKNDLSDAEVLLIDDGATDDTGAICDDYAARFPNIIRAIHQPNGGLGAARNTGIRAAKGEWLLFLDSDDKITHDAVAVLRAAIRPDVDLIGFQFYRDYGTGQPVPQSSDSAPTEQPFALSQRPEELLSLPAAWIRIWRKSLFTDHDVSYPPRAWYEDLRTTAKLLSLARGMVILPNHLYLYLDRPGSIMNSAKLARNNEIMDAIDDIVEWYKARGIFETYQAELEALTVQHVALAASVRVARADYHNALLKEFYDYTTRLFPNWKKNRYNKTLPKPKRLALFLVAHRKYRLLHLLFRMKG